MRTWIAVTVWILIVCASTAISAVVREYLLRGADWLSELLIEAWVRKLPQAERQEMRDTWLGELAVALEKDQHFSGLVFAAGLGVGIYQLRQLRPRVPRATRRIRVVIAGVDLSVPVKRVAVVLSVATPIVAVQLAWPALSAWLTIGFGLGGLALAGVQELVHRRSLHRRIDR